MAGFKTKHMQPIKRRDNSLVMTMCLRLFSLEQQVKKKRKEKQKKKLQEERGKRGLVRGCRKREQKGKSGAERPRVGLREATREVRERPRCIVAIRLRGQQ
jgi:hypothetical protein